MSDDIVKLKTKELNSTDLEKRNLKKNDRVNVDANTNTDLRRIKIENENKSLCSSQRHEIENKTRKITPLENIENPRNYKEIKLVENRTNSSEHIKMRLQEAWDKLQNSSEGKALITQSGDVNSMRKLMSEGRFKLLNRSASLCEKAGLDDRAIGRNVHRMAEIYTFEKHPDDILNGTRKVEQRIDYQDSNGKPHYVEIDDISNLRDGRVVIRDYKPIDLGKFEATQNGKEWAKWAEKNIGKNFREQIMDGASPYFQKSMTMPKEIRSSLKSYLRDISQGHKEQLEKYKTLYSEATKVNPSKVSMVIEPYYKYR